MAKWADYLISAIWTEGGVITHYAMHVDNDDSMSAAMKKTKAQAIAIASQKGITVMTVMWNYKSAKWSKGELVEVVKATPPYLRTDPDNKLTDNLGHLIDYSKVPE